MIEATRADLPAMVETLAAAFVEDPPLAWILPDATDRHRRLAIFFRAILKGTLANGLVLRSPGSDAATLWRLPGKAHPGRWETLLGLSSFAKALGDGARRAQLLSKALRAHEPGFPYYYLQFAGVAPSAQGKGLGGAAIRAGLERARAAGMPAYLETSSARNFELYQHLGFVPRQQWQMPDGGPYVWTMLYR